MEKQKAIVVFSGGQDSTTCLFWALQKFDEVIAVTFDYGQRHKKEIEEKKRISTYKGGIDHEGDFTRNSLAVHLDKCRNVQGDAEIIKLH